MSTNDTTPRDDTPRDDTLTDEMTVETTREPVGAPSDSTTALPVTPAAATASGPAVATGQVGTATTSASPATASADGPWLDGPAPFSIVLGLLGLLTAGAVLLTELADVTFPWADLGPWTVVAAGLVVVLVGAIGLRSSRRSQG